MGKWLAAQTRDFGRPDKKKGTNRAADYKDRRGIILCLNFWGPGSSADHIDLWNGERLASINGNDNYIARSPEVWFWEFERTTTAPV